MRALLYCLKLVSALKAHLLTRSHSEGVGRPQGGFRGHSSAHNGLPDGAPRNSRPCVASSLGEPAALCDGRLWRGDRVWLPFAPLPLGLWKKKPAAMLQGRSRDPSGETKATHQQPAPTGPSRKGASLGAQPSDDHTPSQ